MKQTMQILIPSKGFLHSVLAQPVDVTFSSTLRIKLFKLGHCDVAELVRRKSF